MPKPFIAIDWGTTSFRAYQVGGDGTVLAELGAPEGILSVADGKFDAALESHIGAWDKTLPVLASGMITSRQGWMELPYLDCPAGAADLAKALHVHRSAAGRTIHFATGLHYTSAATPHDVMRSEETQVFGSLDRGASHFVTPGTHSKWIDVADGRITKFATYVTGEVYAVLRHHSILGRLMTGDDDHPEAFLKGAAAAAKDPAGFLHNIFATRTLGLFGDVVADHLSSYLSGVVIGTEVAHAIRHHSKTAHYVVLASPKIGLRYVRAMEAAGLTVSYGDPQAIVKGLREIGRLGGVI
jgi:2-dehydro-3-deoxygalactonokinase